MAGTDSIPATMQYSGGLPTTRGGSVASKPVVEKQSAVSKGTSNRIFAISSASSSATNEAMPSRIEVSNDGLCPINILTGYETYSNETTGAGKTNYLHTMLLPGESFSPPVRSVISTEVDGSDNPLTTQFDGTITNSGNYAVPASAGESNLKTASGATVVSEELNDTTDPIVIETNLGHELFRVGDLLRVANEILRVEGTYDDNPTSSTVADNHIIVSRAHYGSAVASHSGTPAINFAFFNAYHEYDTFSLAQTDALGRFKITNMFGLARSQTATANVGIVPGSFALKFYEPGYQEFGLNGITINTESGLTAGSTYYVKVSIDGATAEEVSFAVDATNTKFGGKNGIVSKLQAAIDALFYDKSKNNFELGAEVTINGGDIRVTSKQRTSSSAIALTAATSGGAASTRLFSGDNAMGRLAGTPKTAVAADLPDLNVYDKITYGTTPSTKNLVYDDGRGNLIGAASGTINYETGAFDMRGGMANASFKYLVNYNSAFSGKLNEGAAGRINSVKEILANTFSQKNGSVVLKTYK